MIATTDVVEACEGVNIAIMLGGFPRKEGMERKEVMSKNISIYKAQATALELNAADNCKVIILTHLFFSLVIEISGVLLLKCSSHFLITGVGGCKPC